MFDSTNKHLLREMNEQAIMERMEEEQVNMTCRPILISPTGERFSLDDLVIRATPKTPRQTD